jgi:glucokinase
VIGAVDIGGTKIAVGMVDKMGQLLAHTDFPTNARLGVADRLDHIAASLREMATQASGELRGIGIGCTGPVYPLHGTIGINAFLPSWEGANLVEGLEARLNVAAALENDADAAALGEAGWGAGRGARTFVYVTVSTGIGGGIIIDGKLYRGVDDAHPEIGHHTIDPSGPLCFCGSHGCWESLASGPAMVDWVRRSRLPGVPEMATLDARLICLHAEQGLPYAVAAVEREGTYLGIGLANLLTMFTPDVVALGGGVMQSYHLFRDRIQATIHTNCGLVPSEKSQLAPATLGLHTGLIGAARVWLARFGEQ